MVEGGRRNSVALATELTIAWLGNVHNRVLADDVPAFLQAIHSTMEQLRDGTQRASKNDTEADAGKVYTPAISARRSLVSPDHIVSMIDGKAYRSLDRHLAANGLTPDEYRTRYKLKADYPMVAPSFAEARRARAQQMGLSGKGRAAKAVAESTKAKAAKPSRTTRKPTEPG